MKKILVAIKNHKYFITINDKKNILLKINSKIYKNSQIMIIIDQNVFTLYNQLIQTQICNIYKNTKNIIIPSGEKFKTLKTLNYIITKLLIYKFQRQSILIAIGGGVIGDLVGFVASVYQRGIRYIQIPTTLLAQIDSSIGGKTAVNHKLGKNMIGTFYQPVSVIINTAFLHTLSKKQISSGIAEIIKYGISFDYHFFKWIEKNIQNLLKLKKDFLSYCIQKCCTIKSQIISKDEKEQKNRVLLNLGHTYGHAIETFTKYTSWSHGESISVGISIAAQTSKNLRLITINEVNRIKKLFSISNLPIQGPKDMSGKDYLSIMKKDKKSVNNKINLILIKKIGVSKMYNNISKDIIIKSIKENNKYN